MSALLIALPSGAKYKFGKDSIVIGRSKKADITTKIKFVSLKHCSVYKQDNRYYIKDLDSSNGTYVNRKKITEPRMLKNDDIITLGPKGAVFQFHKTTTMEHPAVRKQIKNLNKTYPVAAALILIFVVVYVLLTSFGKINIDKELSEIRAVHGENNIPTDPEFITLVEDYVMKIKDDSMFDIVLERRAKYINTIENILRANNIPPDFSFLAWVESKFDPEAYNPFSGAKGMWQMVPATARQYGLTVNSKTDERTDPEKSTMAAAGYLSDLISIFGHDSFTLAIASYNAGDGEILYRLKQVENPVTDRNFWYLCEHGLMPAETKHYVIQVIALMVLSKRM
jgi:pSer/pThr/pTyr-binding forkhead associated (FHA) protein